MNQEPSQLLRLDWVLNYMAKHGVQGLIIEAAWDDLKLLHPTLHIEGNESYRIQILDKLREDGYIVFDLYGRGDFMVTFNGIIFSEQGGYTGLEKAKINENSFQRTISIYLAVGSFLAAFGTLGLLFFEYLKMKSRIPVIEGVTTIFLILSTCIGTIITLLLVSEILPRITKSQGR